MSKFNSLRIPLSGRHLIDASAGTGKTYTISILVIRLLLERGLSIREILVVTYTIAATEDLRVRVRQMIREMLDAFSEGKSNDQLFQGLLDEVEDHEQAMGCLRDALRDFDEAAIFTIHGFCQRMLRENCLESGALFETELVADLGELEEEIVEDYWRQQSAKFAPGFRVFCRKSFTPDSLLKLFRQGRLGQGLAPDAGQLPDADVLVSLENDFSQAFARVKKEWPAAREQVSNLLQQNEALKKNSYKKEKLPEWLDELDRLFLIDSHHLSPDLGKFFSKFTTASLEKAAKKNHEAPRHHFFDLCQGLEERRQELADGYNSYLLCLKGNLFAYCREELAKRKEQRNILGFDDLLHQFNDGLHGAGGAALAKAVREKFPAALIDEFQDTDPVQYDIFTSIYRPDPGCLLYLIGDPKQAIYSFRGADIFAYLKAVRDLGEPFTLDVNYRSEPGLIRAVNTLFDQPHDPFYYPEISFSQVKPASLPERKLLEIDGKESLVLWVADRSRTASKVIKVDPAREMVLTAVAGEISRLLTLGHQGRAGIGDDPLGPNDIAILVRTNMEARQARDILANQGIAAVIHSDEDLFSSIQALEILRVLAAVVDSANEMKIKAALATDILGGDCSLLFNLKEDEKWQRWLTAFREYRRIWFKRGFARMFRALLDREEVRPRLLCKRDGERQLTNVLHLGEVLHQASLERETSMAGLLKFLEEHLQDNRKNEEYELRLESDSELVRIITIHKAKGLQYAVVFCPFCWSGSRLTRSTVFSFHQQDQDNRVMLELGSEQSKMHKEMAMEEELAENLRLLYVALTRAVHRCYLAWGPFYGADSSALAWLLHHREGADFVDVAKCFKNLSDGEIMADLAPLVEKSDGAISIEVLPDAGENVNEKKIKGDTELFLPEFVGRIDRNWRITSFSGLTSLSSSRSHVVELPDYDFQEVGKEGEMGEKKSIFTFPKGAGPGTFLHDVLEHLDFTEVGDESDKIAAYVEDKLTAYGFEPHWRDVIVRMLADLVSTPLLAQDPALTLERVGQGQRLNEMEFYFPLADIHAVSMHPVLAKVHSLPAGFLKGFIDLVFEADNRYYLVDWKSNYLGATIEDYNQERLQEVMEREQYILQYHLYTVALHQYLGSRLTEYRYDDHFGGVFYLFLRGI
ncbi:MAG: exodeoxyribonuclease V subunit beta, partial [Thermodesulfobacteriota bacterium]|nr:exodeoxyribonuclease V subunit beta [Thermodesulfobacteriota bacterium]